MRFLRMFLLLSFALLGACQPQAPTPTPLPTATATATATVTPTRTPFPTPEPSATPLQTISDDPAKQSQIRIIHASSNIGALDVYIEHSALVNNIAYGQRTTSSPIVAGTYTLSIVPNGGRLDDGTLLKIPLEAKGQDTNVLVIYGSNADLKAQVIALDLSPLKKTESRVRLFNTFTDGGPVTVVNTLNEGAVLGGTAANSLSPSQAFASNGASLQVRAGTITLADVDAPFDPLSSTLLVVAGTSTDRATMQVIAVDAPVIGEGRVRLLGAIEGLFDLDVYADNILLTERLGDNVLSPTVTLPSGTHNLTVYPHGADRAATDPITGTEIQVLPDDDIIVALFGTPESIQFETMVEDTSPTALGRARIVLFNPVSTATRVSVVSDVLPEIVPVNYGRFSAAYDVPARMTSFEWSQSNSRGDVETLETAIDQDIRPGQSYLYIFDARGMVNFNFLYERNVGESASVVSSAITPTPLPATAQPAPKLRMVNAIIDQFVEFRLDDIAVTKGLPYANATSSILTQPGEHTLTVHSSDGTRLLARVGITLEPSMSYSAYVYGDLEPYNIMLIPDRPLYDLSAPAFRVVNLSTQPRQVGLAIAQYIPLPPTAIPVETPIESTGYSIPGGIRRLAYDVPPLTATEFDYYQVSTPQTLFILDADADLVNMTLTNLTFNPNMSYEVIIFKGINLPTQAFVATYTP